MNSAETVWITGAAGFIGSELVRAAQRVVPTWRIVPIFRETIALENPTAIEARFRIDRPTLILHTAALSRSPDCEANPDLARRTNVGLTRTLVEATGGARMLLVSTDLVFDGQMGDYRETDSVNPLSLYGETKAEAERLVLARSENLVVRTSLNFGFSPRGNHAFNEEMANGWRQGKSYRLFVDEFRCPIFASDTARLIWMLLRSDGQGLFHLAGSERLSRWDTGLLVANYYQRNGQRHFDNWNPECVRVEQGSLREYRGAARAPDTSLNCHRLEKQIEESMPSFRSQMQNLDVRPALKNRVESSTS